MSTDQLWRCSVLAVLILIAYIAVLTGLNVVEIKNRMPREAPVTTVVACVEDDPCWDCSTMGNRLCGPQVSTP